MALSRGERIARGYFPFAVEFEYGTKIEIVFCTTAAEVAAKSINRTVCTDPVSVAKRACEHAERVKLLAAVLCGQTRASSHLDEGKCFTCGGDCAEAPLYACCGCFVAHYCNPTCQRADWSIRKGGHSVTCSALAFGKALSRLPVPRCGDMKTSQHDALLSNPVAFASASASNQVSACVSLCLLAMKTRVNDRLILDVSTFMSSLVKLLGIGGHASTWAGICLIETCTTARYLYPPELAKWRTSPTPIPISRPSWQLAAWMRLRASLLRVTPLAP